MFRSTMYVTISFGWSRLRIVSASEARLRKSRSKSLARSEPVSDTGGEVRPQVPLRRRTGAPRLGDELIEVLPGPRDGPRDPLSPEPPEGGIPPRSPHRVYHRQPRKTLPRLPEVVDLNTSHTPDA